MGSERVLEANSALEATRSGAAAAGPATAGVLAQAVGAPAALLVDCCSFVASAISVATIRTAEPRPGMAPLRNLRSEIFAGAGFIARSPWLRGAVAGSASFNLFLCRITTLYLVRGVGLSPALLGLILGIGSLGLVAGSISAAPLPRRFGYGRTMVAGVCAAGLAQLAIPLVTRPTAASAALLTASEVVNQFGVMVFAIGALSLRQRLASPAMQGRVNAGARCVTYGALPLGAVVSGSVAALVGIRPGLALLAGGEALSCAWLLLTPVGRLRDLPGPVCG